MTTAHADRRTGPPAIASLHAWLDIAATLFRTLAEISLVVMLVLNVANLVLRNLAGTSLLWVAPWTETLLVWMVFLGFFPIYRNNLDVSLSFVIARCPKMVRHAGRALVSLCGLAVCGVVLAEAPEILSRQVGEMQFVHLQRYALSAPLIASSALLAVHFVLALFWPDADPHAAPSPP